MKRLDDALRYGDRNPIKKWWLDLEIRNKKVEIPRGVNERGLTLERETKNDNKNIAVYPVEKLPKADAKGPVPLDRKQGLEDCEEAARALDDLKG